MKPRVGLLLISLGLLLTACAGQGSPAAFLNLPSATITLAVNPVASLTPFSPATSTCTFIPTLTQTWTPVSSATEKPLPTNALLDPLTITIIYDNIPDDPRLKTDWGFSAYIQYHNQVVLFDTGANGQFLFQNMQILAIDPASVQAVVLSHIHNDHTGGLEAFLSVAAHPPVYLLAAFGDPFIKQTQWMAEVVDAMPGQEITEDILTTGEVPGNFPEQALVIRTPRGLIVLTGCAHPGIVRMVEKAIKLTGEPVYMVLGGFHLLEANDIEIETILADLKRLGVQVVAPSHCTGEHAITMFVSEYGVNFLPSGAGNVISLTWK
jgi:7,8-dihydropterin-6-yl-methyl-4-(beta-D-ribofuranosyl)aminobenzene 5'-phosphate synthase